MNVIDKTLSKIYNPEMYYLTIHKNKIRKQGGYDVLFLVDDGWNTIEEHIPVLYYIKKHFPEKRILTFLLTRHTMEMISQHPGIWHQVQDVSDTIIYNGFPYYESSNRCLQAVRRLNVSLFNKALHECRNSLLDALLKGCEIRAVLFAGAGGEELGIDYIRMKYPMPRTRYILHAQSPFIGIHSYKHGIDFPVTGLAATCSQEITRIPENDRKKIGWIESVGSPKYDPWWTNQLQKTSGTRNYKDAQILVMLPKLNEVRFPQGDREEFKKFLTMAKQYRFVLKFHPRQLKNEKDEFLRQMMPCDCQYEVSDDSLLNIFQEVPCVISIGMTGASADALLAGNMLVEFYNDFFQEGFYPCGNGYGTFLHQNDCVPHAKDADSLFHVIEGFFHKDLWKQYESRFQQYLPAENHACERISEMLLQGEDAK